MLFAAADQTGHPSSSDVLRKIGGLNEARSSSSPPQGKRAGEVVVGFFATHADPGCENIRSGGDHSRQVAACFGSPLSSWLPQKSDHGERIVIFVSRAHDDRPSKPACPRTCPFVSAITSPPLHSAAPVCSKASSIFRWRRQQETTPVRRTYAEHAAPASVRA